MKVKENPNLNQINWTRVVAIFALVKWSERIESEIKAAFEQSTFTCFVYEKDVLVGFGRTYDDGKYYATICDVAIDPNYQGTGIGTEIMNSLKNRIKGYQIVTLTAAPGKEGFYGKLGWKKQKTAFMNPKDEKQVNDFCE